MHLSSALLFNRALLGWGGMTADYVHELLRALFSQHCFKARRKPAWPRHLASPGPRPPRCWCTGLDGHGHSNCRGRPPQTGRTCCRPRRMCPAPAEGQTAWHPPGRSCRLAGRHQVVAAGLPGTAEPSGQILMSRQLQQRWRIRKGQQLRPQLVVLRRFQWLVQSLPPAQASLAAGPHWHLQHLLPWLVAAAAPAVTAAVLAGA